MRRVFPIFARSANRSRHSPPPRKLNLMIDEATFRRESDRAPRIPQAIPHRSRRRRRLRGRRQQRSPQRPLRRRRRKVRLHPQHSRPPDLDLRPIHQLQARLVRTRLRLHPPKTGEALKPLTQRLLANKSATNPSPLNSWMPTSQNLVILRRRRRTCLCT